MKIKEIEYFDWPSKKREIAKHTFLPKRSDYSWMWGVAFVLALLAGAFLYVHITIVSPFLELKVQEAEASYMTDEEICANLDRFINGEEFEEYCQTNYGV